MNLAVLYHKVYDYTSQNAFSFGWCDLSLSTPRYLLGMGYSNYYNWNDVLMVIDAQTGNI